MVSSVYMELQALIATDSGERKSKKHAQMRRSKRGLATGLHHLNLVKQRASVGKPYKSYCAAMAPKASRKTSKHKGALGNTVQGRANSKNHLLQPTPNLYLVPNLLLAHTRPKRTLHQPIAPFGTPSPVFKQPKRLQWGLPPHTNAGPGRWYDTS